MPCFAEATQGKEEKNMRGGGNPLAVIAVIGLAFSAYQYFDGRARAKRAEHKNDVQMAKQERRAKLMQLKEYNQAMQVMNRGRMIAERTILEDQRKKDSEEKFYGKPV